MSLEEKLKQKVEKKVFEGTYKAIELCNQADLLLENASTNKDPSKAVKAVNLYYEALKYNVKEIRVYIGLAYILYNSDDIYGAIGALNQAIKIDPNHKKVNEWLEIFSKEYTQNAKSIQLSMIAGKALNSKFKSNEGSKVSIFDKVSSFFAKQASKNQTISLTYNKKSPALSKVLQNTNAPANIFEAIRQVKSIK